MLNDDALLFTVVDPDKIERSSAVAPVPVAVQ